MIASLTGRVGGLTSSGVVLVVGGVGLAVQTTPGTRARLRAGEDAHLATSLIVREDSLTLFGFESEDDILSIPKFVPALHQRFAHS